MELNEPFTMDISGIHLAHEFVLDAEHKCDFYLNGRGTYGMVYGIGGTAEYRFRSGERLTVNEGDTLLLSPEAAYSIFTREPFRHYTVNFRVRRENSFLDVLDKPFCLLRSSNPEQFGRLFGKLNKAWMQKNDGYQMLSVSHLYALVSLFYFEYKNRLVPFGSDARLRPAKEYIEENFRSPITLEQLAKSCDMSVTNFRREWRRVYRSTPIQYRDQIRLSCAKEYLISGYYSVAEVAGRCGFENPTYFIRFFGKHVGMTPGEFKKQSLSD